uniref:Interferon-inducible GTPase 5-like n=1 Tax=Haplochromis burtoni TaxID=8153 RepID=A0A3Q2X0L5_HAPBU
MEDFISGVKNKLKNNNAAAAAAQIKQYLKEPRKIPLYIAITGESSSGKSTFINAFRGIGDEDDGAAPTDVAESSKDPIPYFHPDYPNVSLWDLPGIGTPKYPADKYLRSVPFKKYDFYIIVSADHLTENDVKLAKEIQRMMKKFYFVHSKTDNDINVGKRKKDFTAEGTLSKIRKNCVEGLQKQGIECPQVFLVSSFEPGLYDFPLLRKTLEKELDVQRDALLLDMPKINQEIIRKKKEAFQSKIKYYSTLSAGVAGVPLPGLSTAVDISMMVIVVREYVAEFGLDKPSLEKLAATTGVSYTDLQSVIKSELVKAQVTADLIMKLLLSLASTAALMAAEEATRWVPVVGLVASMGLSFSTTSKEAGLVEKLSKYTLS